MEPQLLAMEYSGNKTEEKSSMSFWCFADGKPVPMIVWLHNKSLILADMSPRHQVTTVVLPSPARPHTITAINSTLTVSGVRLRDAGEYLCRVDPANIEKARQDVPEPFVVVVYSGTKGKNGTNILKVYASFSNKVAVSFVCFVLFVFFV